MLSFVSLSVKQDLVQWKTELGRGKGLSSEVIVVRLITQFIITRSVSIYLKSSLDIRKMPIKLIDKRTLCLIFSKKNVYFVSIFLIFRGKEQSINSGVNNSVN